LNRIDEQILFRSLEQENIQRILEPILSDICSRLKEQHGIILVIDQQLKEMLAKKGYKPEYGARELRRVVERELEAKLAEKLLMHQSKNTITWHATIEDENLAIK